MKYLRWLLFPFSIVYGLVVMIRNWLYDAGLFESRSYTEPVISVGNLDVGGAGKSPMTEYLIRLLKNDHRLATLSRGYGRATKGFVLADAITSATELGYEPAQFKQKFPDVTVAVCEERTVGIERLLPQHDVVLLDDAYQHRAVKPGLSLLLFDHDRLSGPQLLLPAGNLREQFVGRYRADVLVVTKCPADLTEAQQRKALQKLKPLSYQQVYFTAISYMPLQDMYGERRGGMPPAGSKIFVLTGIANPDPLIGHLKHLGLEVVHHNYPDHHQFSLKNITKLAADLQHNAPPGTMVITTEKDAQRLRQPDILPHVEALPFYVLPIGVMFLNDAAKRFNETIQNYVRQY